MASALSSGSGSSRGGCGGLARPLAGMALSRGPAVTALLVARCMVTTRSAAASSPLGLHTARSLAQHGHLGAARAARATQYHHQTRYARPFPIALGLRAQLSTSSWVRSPSSTQSNNDTAASGSTDVAKKESKDKGSMMTRTWAKVKKEASHYWHGTKLLGKEIRISVRLQMRLLMGKKLTRREHRQLKRTTQDLLRLIPFSVFLIVPFMEFLLPVALRLFPNMLPSTFEDKFRAEEKKRKLLKVRLEMAKFLQETIRESGIRSREKIVQSEEFKEFFRKVRSTGETPSTDEIVKVARLFENDLTLDNLSRPQLVSICRYMNINAFGTDNFLRYTIRNRMKQIKEDDRVIESEGINALSLPELQSACQSRGIRSNAVSERHMRAELHQWIDLHLHRGLSGTLLILSKAFSYLRPVDQQHVVQDAADDSSQEEILRSLKTTLASLPDALLNETELDISSDEASYKQRLEVLQEQEELIEEEEEQEQKEQEARRLKKEAEEEAQASEEAARKEREEQAKLEREVGQADDLLPEQEKPAVADETQPDPEKVRLTSEQVTELGNALQILSAKSSVLKERSELRQMMAEHEKSEGEKKDDPLAKRVRKILERIDRQLEDYDAEVGSKLNMFEADRDGQISVSDLRKVLEVIKHRPSNEDINILLDKLDVNHDARVPLNDLVSLAEGEGLGIVVNDDEVANELVETAKAARPTVTESPEETAEAVIEPKAAKASSKKDEPKLKKEDIVDQ